MSLALPLPAAEAEGRAVSTAVLPAVARALGLGLAITLLQILCACLLSGQPDFPTAYRALYQWDSGWYASFVERGYYSPPTLSREDHGNVSFLPAYPLAACLVRRVTGWTTCVCLLVAAQLAAWGFWTYLFLLFRRWRLSATLTALGTLLIVSNPAAFFLVAGYTESLFLFGLLGLVYWTGERSARSLCPAALHGFVMTATRLVGAPLAIYPLLHHWATLPRPISPRSWPRLLRGFLPALAVSGVAALGVALFFLYCRCRFGQWDLLSESQFVGWTASANYFAFFSWRTYCPKPPFLRDGFLNPIWLNQFLVPLTVACFAVLFGLEYRQRRSFASQGWRVRTAWYVCALLMLYIVVCGNATTGMYSMVRYLLPINVLVTLAVIHRLSRVSPADRRPGLRFLTWGLIGLGFLIQIWLAYRFTHGQWVA